MSFMSAIFGPKPVDVQVANQNQQVQQTQQQTQQPPNADPAHTTQRTEQTDANGVVPKQTKEVSPLDEHKDLWQAPETKKEEEPANTLTPEKMFESAAKVDFSKILDQAELAKIEGGGKDAMLAVSNLLNKTAQAVYGQSMVAAHKMVNLAVENASSKFTSKVPDLLRNQTAQAEIYKANPALNNPILAPIIEAIQTQLAIKKPDATADELKSMSMAILQGSANLINPQSGSSKNNDSDNRPKGGRNKNKEEEEDWMEWINHGSDKPIQ